MRDWLDGALLEAEEVEAERGVVLAELRGLDRVRQRLIDGVFSVLVPDTLLARAAVIGTRESLQAVVQPEFVEFYTEYYTPQRSTFIVVGDIDPDEIEGRIAAAFSNASNPTTPGTDLDLGSVEPGMEFRTAAFADREFEFNEVYIYSARNCPEAKLDTVEKRRADVSLSLANEVLTRRLDILVKEEGSPISHGYASELSLIPVRLGWVAAVALEGRLEEAIMLLEQEFRRFLTFGITQAEFDESKANFLNKYERQVQGADTQESSALAAELVNSINSRKVVSAPQEDLRIVSEALDVLTPEQVHSSFIQFWATEDIALVYLTKEIDGNTTDVMEAAYNKSLAVTVDPPADDSNLTFAYTDFGEPGTIVSDKVQADLDIRQLILSNNVRVNMKKTDFEDNSIVIEAIFGSGKLSQPANMTDLDLFGAYVITLGGLGQHSNDELTRLVAGKSVDVRFTVADTHFLFSGETEPEDLAMQLQLMAARLSDPGYREEAVRLYRNDVPIRLSQFKHSTSGPWQELSQFLKSGDNRYGIPTEEQMLSYEADDVMVWIGSQLSDSYLELSIVGDFPDETLDLILETIGALPMRADAPDASDDTDLVFPETPQAVEFSYESQDPQAVVALSFEIMPLTEATIIDTRHMSLLATIFKNRLFLEIREELGAAYSPGTSANSYLGIDHGEFTAYASVAPENATVVADRIQQISQSLSAGSISEDEVVRAVEPLLSDLEVAKQSNARWLSGILSGSQAYPYYLDWARTRDQTFESITASDVNSLAAIYLPLTKAIVVSMLPVDTRDADDEAQDRLLATVEHHKFSGKPLGFECSILLC